MEKYCPYYWVVPASKAKDESRTARMLQATTAIHDSSDKLVNAKMLLAWTDKTLYGEALGLLYFVFKALDKLLQSSSADHPPLKSFLEESRYKLLLSSRVQAFEEDLLFYLGDNWLDRIRERCQPHSVKYRKHLTELANSDPVYLLPYYYHLSLALLAGGQVIKKLTLKAFSKADASVQVFDYPTEGSKRYEVKGSLKSAVDALVLSEEQDKVFIVESKRCFELNNSMILSFYQEESIFKYALGAVVSLLKSSKIRLAIVFAVMAVLWFQGV